MWVTVARAMSTTPSVKIKRDAACPLKAACAGNHQVGWLQVMLTDASIARDTHTAQTISCPFPIRDAVTGSPHPWYLAPATFTGDNDTQAAHFEDSPGWSGIGWTDPRGAAPGVPAPPPPPPAVNLQLRRARRENSFNAWLVVRNEEWWAHDEPGSFAFQRHLYWSNDLDCAVTTANAVGSRCAPTRRRTAIDGQGAGRGGAAPILTVPIYNNTASVATAAAPGMP